MSANAKKAEQQRQQRLDNWQVYKLYIIIVLVLGILGIISLLMKQDTYTGSIITALSTVAGLAVGDVANDSRPSSG